MDSPTDRPRPLSPGEARQRVDVLLGIYNGIVLTAHSRHRGQERHYDIFDIRKVLENGAPSVDEWDDRYQNWKYKFAGTDVDGEPLTVVVVIEDVPVQAIRVVTAHG